MKADPVLFPGGEVVLQGGASICVRTPAYVHASLTLLLSSDCLMGYGIKLYEFPAESILHQC